MSALLIGRGCRMGSVIDRLIEMGFNEVAFRNCDSMGGCFPAGLCRPDVVIVIKDGLAESDLGGICSKAGGLEVPVVIW